MKTRILLWTLGSGLSALACGVAPHDADAELDRLGSAPLEWCGTDVHEIDDVIDKTPQVPDGYGHLSNRYSCRADGQPWPGGHCWVPEYTAIIWRNNLNSGSSSWNLSQTGAMNEIEEQLESVGWEILQSSSDFVYETKVDNGPVGPGPVGEADFNDFYYVQSHPQGELRSFVTCKAIIYRGRVLQQAAWQGASSAARDRYVKNLVNHEGMHCAGLAHQSASGLLMSASHGTSWYDSDYDPTAAEMNDLDAWDLVIDP